MSFGVGRNGDRDRGFFRGRELAGLVLFVAIACAGWPLLLAQLRRSRSVEPVAPAAPPDPRPIVPDDSPAFQAIRDKTPSEFREITAYAELLKRVRETSPEELAKDARRDLFFTHLWERPSAYRGVPIHLEGTMKRALSYEAKPELTPKGRLYEAWFITEESRRFPYVVVVEDAPEGFAVGDQFSEPIVVDGYFFKLLAYRAGDTARAAPMLIGRIRLPKAASAAPVAAAKPTASPLWTNPGLWAVVALFVYVSVRLYYQWKRIAPVVLPKSIPLTDDFGGRPTDPPTEADVSDFLAGLENGDSDTTQ